MTLLTTLVLSTLLPSAPQGTLRLPETQRREQAPQASATDVQRFQRVLLQMRTAGDRAEVLLQDMPSKFADLESLIIERVRTARAREVEDLMVVARRYGTPKVADELLFQLLTRGLGEATRDVMTTMAMLKGEGSKRALMECVQGRIAGVRRAATEQLVGLVGPEDLHFCLRLSGEQSLDLQLCGVELLGAIPDPKAHRRLVELLAKEPTVAGMACSRLLRLGQDAVETLIGALQDPSIDRTHAYVAFVLTQVQPTSVVELLPTATLEVLRGDLDDPDPTTRCLAAIALATVAFRSEDPDPARFRDADLVEAMLDVVAPRDFVPNLALMREPAEQRLVALTGRAADGGQVGWREWWGVAAEGFHGMRARVGVDAGNAAKAVLELRGERLLVRMLGEALASASPLAGANEIVLTGEQMLDLLGRLRKLGFMADPTAAAPSVTRRRTLQLQVLGARSLVAEPLGGAPSFDRLVAVVDETLRSELWQLYRDPVDEPDRGAFWRSERRWLVANPEQQDRARRFARRLIKVWPRLNDPMRSQGLAVLFAHPDKAAIIGEEDGLAMVALVRGGEGSLTPRAASLGKNEMMLLELAASAPGEQVWRLCIDAAARMSANRENVTRLFAMLGADHVLTALSDERSVVREAAIDETVRIRDARANRRLVAMLDDPDPAVRRSAVFASGLLELDDARPRIIELIVAEDAEPVLRRECLRSLGRIGGESVFVVLERAMAAPAKEDRDAALRGMGELQEQRAANLLAELFIAGQGTETGELSRFYLQRMGALMAVPALRPYLKVQNPESRRELVMLLGSLQDPEIVPDLIDLLRQGGENLRVAQLLEAITGFDVATRQDRVFFLDQWWRAHRGEETFQWLLAALRVADVSTTLKREQFDPAAGLSAVPELARLLLEAPDPRLRSLTAAVLRKLTGEEYGIVTLQTPPGTLQGLAARYRVLYESSKSASVK